MNNNKNKEAITYKILFNNLIKFLTHSTNQLKNSKIIDEVENIGFDRKPLLYEATYINIFALLLALKSKFPNNYEQIFLDFKKRLTRLDIKKENIKITIKEEINLNTKMAEYMEAWNDSLKEKKKGLSENHLLSFSNKIAQKIYKQPESNDIRIVMCITSLFTGPLKGFKQYLDDCDINIIK